MPSTSRRALLGALAGGSLAALAGCSSSCPDSGSPEPETLVQFGRTEPFDGPPGTEWPAPRFDAANTGYTADATVPSDSLAVRWRTAVPDTAGEDPGPPVSAPVVAGDRVLVGTSDGVTALRFRDGSEVWHADAVTPTVVEDRFTYRDERVPPVVAGDTVYAGGTDGLVALDLADGSVRWRYDASDVRPPAVVDDTVYALAGGGLDAIDSGDGLVALDAGGGTERWGQGLDVGPGYPAVADGTAVVAGNGFTWGLDAQSGDIRWQSDLRTDYPPVVADGLVYVGNYDGLHAIGLDDGDTRWTFERGSGRALTAPVVTDDTIYLVEQPGEAGDATFALDRTDGPPEPRWCHDVSQGAVTGATSDLAVGLLSGVGAPGDPGADLRLVGFDERLGASRWGLTNETDLLAPAVVDGAIVAADRRGTVLAVGEV